MALFFAKALFLLMRGQLRERGPLRAVGQEIGGIEPALEDRFASRPLAVEDGEPGSVAISALHDHVLPEDAFELKAVAKGGSS